MRQSFIIAAVSLLLASLALAACSNETNEPQSTGSVDQPASTTEAQPSTSEPPATTNQ